MTARSKIYHERKAAGLCPYCGGDRKDKSRVVCHICRMKAKVWHKDRYEALKEQGKCAQCGKSRDALEGQILCADCKVKNRQRELLKNPPKPKKPKKPSYRTLREQGRCVYCAEPSDTGMVFCSNCKLNKMKREWLKYEQTVSQKKNPNVG